jgi:hypothetical protein
MRNGCDGRAEQLRYQYRISRDATAIVARGAPIWAENSRAFPLERAFALSTSDLPIIPINAPVLDDR